MTVAERNELLDAVEALERELEKGKAPPPGIAGFAHDPLLVALAELLARTIRVWVTADVRR